MKIKKWIKNNCEDLTNKRIVVTGATGGIGRELCFMLAELGADLTLVCRNYQKANQLIIDIKKEYNNIKIDFVELDLFNIKSVKKCINQLKKYNGIDILINNAGVYNIKVEKLDSGFNNIFQTNFLYTYYFTRQLLPELEKKNNSTCITISSIAHNYSKIDELDIDFSNRKKASKIYGNSKRFLMFSLYELFKNSSANLSIVHPGITLTNMTGHYPKIINWFVKFAIKILFPNPKKAALNILFGINNHTANNQWIGPSIFDIWGSPKVKNINTCSIEENEKILQITENLYYNIENKN